MAVSPVSPPKKVWEVVTGLLGALSIVFLPQTFISTLTALTALTEPVFMRVLKTVTP
jgi:hypothetical protein